MTTFQGHGQQERTCLVAVVALLAAIALPRLLETRSMDGAAGLAKLCEAARAPGGTACLDSESAAPPPGPPRFVEGRLVVDAEPGVTPYERGRFELGTAWSSKAFLERGEGFVAVERSASLGGRVALALVALVVGGVSFFVGRDMAGERRGVRRVLLVAAFLVLNPCLLLPLHGLGLVERVEVRAGEAARIRSWFGGAPSEEPLGRVRGGVSTAMNGVWLLVEGPLGVRPEPVCRLSARDPRLDASLRSF